VKRGKRILIIKLAAIGDVIRTTPIITKLRQVYPNCEITWVTYFPEVIPKTVDYVLKFDATVLLRLQADHFDLLLQLDKGKEACALGHLVSAKVKKGFELRDGLCYPIDENSVEKYLTGLDDELNRKVKICATEEYFRIAGLEYNKEKYILDIPPTDKKFPKLPGPIIGLNTGCSSRWPTRLWPEQNWIELAKRLDKKGYSVLLLGGEIEHEKNKRIASESGANYWGHHPLGDFINIVNKCDLVVTVPTLALHIAIALEKKIVLFNNIFNRNEFELYGLGEILEPDVDCLGCFKTECSKNCMEKIKVDDVVGVIDRLLKGGSGGTSAKD